MPNDGYRVSLVGRLHMAVRRHGGALGGYTIIALLFTYPTVLHLTTAVVGQLDVLENYWNLWWTRQAVLRLHQNPFRGMGMHYPFGLPLYFHTYNPLNGFLSLPIQVCCGTAAAYNLLNVFAFVMAGLGMYALVGYLTPVRPAAWIGGLIYAFSPYMAFHLHMGQSNLVALHWMPWYLLALLKGLRDRWVFLPVAAVTLLLNALTDWHYVVFALTITGVVGLYEVTQLRRLRQILLLAGKLTLVGGLFALLAAPVLVPMVAELQADPSATRPLEHSIWHSADLLAFLLPNPFHPLWGEWASGVLYNRLVPPGIVGGIGSIGYVALALALYGIASDRRRGLLFVLILLVGGVLALGPYLQINGVNSSTTARPIPMPYLILRQLPFMAVLRIPSRFVVVVMLALAVLAGQGVAAFWQRFAAGRHLAYGRGLLALLTLLVLFENWPRPFRFTPIGPDRVSPFYRQLGAYTDDFAVLDVPYRSPQSFFYQTYHHKPTLGGRIARPKEHPWRWARFFGPLIQSERPWRDIGADDSAGAWRAALLCQNVRYVVFYKQDLQDWQAEGSQALQQQLFAGIRPAYEDATLRAYGPLDDPSHEAYWTPAPGEWYDTETNERGINYRWMKGAYGSLLVYPCGRTDVVLRFAAYGLARPRTLEIRANGRLAHTITLPRETLVPVEVPLSLRDGENRVELRSVEPPTSPAASGSGDDPRLLSINLSEVSIRPR